MHSVRIGRRRRLLGLLLLVGLLAVAAALSLAFGARVVSWQEFLAGVTGSAGPSDIGAIAVQERIPRTVFTLVAGAALGVSGALMQALTRNPIADPGILGINTGAALGVVVSMSAFGLSTLPQYLAFALLGGLVTAVAVYAIASLGSGGATPVKLALAGVATTAVLTSLVSVVTLTQSDVLDVWRHWTVGSVGRGSWESLAIISPLLIIAAALAAFSLGPLNSLALGDEAATGLGVNVLRTRILVAVSGVLLCASVTAVAGPISFVGLMVPHIVRFLVGPNQAWVVPLSALGGATLLLLADVIGRVVVRPGELAVGLITAFVCAPMLIVIARRSKVREL
ncbi:FecCD family ABC transporter permease [Gulosibacter sediminis]|uniref:FecCD family ABC transporter permease n=1 Tax=Gulosibacter sediminis TaxID=1729695 RepID=UPI002E2D7DE6|nr:iron chelate uptake ABC transporter family permease subunit [Gulosibacter sediminis]